MCTRSSYEGGGTYQVDLDHGVIVHADADGTIKIFAASGPTTTKSGDAPAKSFHGEGFSRDREQWTPTWARPTTQPTGK